MARVSVIVLLTLLSASCFGQLHDAGAWLGTDIRFRIKKRMDLVVSHQIRTKTLSSQFDQFFIEPELRYKLKNGLRFAVAYRPSLKFDLESGASIRHRYHLQLDYGIDLGDWEIGTRVRFQQRFVPIRRSERLPSSEQPIAIRNKWSVEYTDFKKLEPFIQFEYFLNLSGQAPIQIGTLRYKAGVEFDLPKKLFLSLFYMMEQEIANEQPFFNHVIGIGVSREFDIRVKD
jgi:hypothetical protein